MTATETTVLLIAVAGVFAFVAAVLTFWDLKIASKGAPAILKGSDATLEFLTQDEFGGSPLAQQRAATALAKQLSGNWRTRTAAVLVLLSILIGTIGGIIGAVKAT